MKADTSQCNTYLQWACKDAVYKSLHQCQNAALGIKLSVYFVHVFLCEPTLVGVLNISSR